MARGAELVIRILTDATQAAKGIDQAKGGFDKFEQGMKSAAIPAAAVAGGIALIGTAAIRAASDLEQSIGGVDAVFGDSADQIKAWGEQAAESAGLSQAAYSQSAVIIGAQLKNLGVPMSEVAGSTNDMIALGADLAAQFGGSTQQAVDALSSALAGESEPAKRYGLALNQTAVNAELAAQGLSGLEGEQLTAAKAAVIMQLATEDAGSAVGAFAREDDTAAGAAARSAAAWENTAAALGTALLPMVTAAADGLKELAGWVQKNTDWLVPLGAAIFGVAAAILVINGALIAYRAAQTAAAVATAIFTAVQKAAAAAALGTRIGLIALAAGQLAVSAAQKIAAAAQWALNAAMTANPIGLIIAAVVALVAAFIYLWNTNEDFRNFFIDTWAAIAAFFAQVWAGARVVVGAAVAWFRSAWAAVAGWFESVWEAVAGFFKGIWNGLITVISGVVNTIRSVIGTVAKFFEDVWRNAVLGVSAVIRTLQAIFTSVFAAIMAPINAVARAFDAVIDAIKSVISWLGRIKIPDVLGAIGGIVGMSVVAPAGVPALSTYTGAAATRSHGMSTSTSGGITINVQGGLDSGDAIARRIDQVLTARLRRTGGVSIARPLR